MLKLILITSEQALNFGPETLEIASELVMTTMISIQRILISLHEIVPLNIMSKW